MLIALLDTSVLFPAPLRDTLLRAGAANLFYPAWTAVILDELRRNLMTDRGLTESQADGLIQAMVRGFPDAMIMEFEHLIDGMLNDPKDRHVAAAAVAAQADAIVTSNLRHFPTASISPFRLRAMSPDDFLCSLLDAAPEQMAELVREQAADLRRPLVTREELLRMLGKHAPEFAARVAQFSG